MSEIDKFALHRCASFVDSSGPCFGCKSVTKIKDAFNIIIAGGVELIFCSRPCWKSFDFGRQEFDPTGRAAHAPGTKLGAGKPRVDLVLDGFPRALLAVAEVAAYGAEKYSAGGWRHVPGGQQRYRAAGDRHRLQGAIRSTDEDSGLLHLAQRAWNALAELELHLEESKNE